MRPETYLTRLPGDLVVRPAPQPARTTSEAPLHQDRDRIAPRLERRLGDVAEIFAVGLQRERPVAAHDDPVEVVTGDDVVRLELPLPPHDVAHQARHVARAHPGR